jgi:hypothetical protein
MIVHYLISLKKNPLISFSSIRYRPLFLCFCFCMLAIVLRFFSFFPSVIDHDESTYLEIARMLLSGKTLYVDMIDIKPPGIFLILAGFQAVFGHSIFVMRLLVAIWVGLTAYLVYLTGNLLFKDNRAAIASGFIYIFFISTWSYYGVSITPEIFFNLFTISSLYILLKMKSQVRYFWAGLLAGVGFIIKYLVLFDFTVFIAFIVISEYRSGTGKRLPRAIYNLILAGSGFLLPFGLTNLWYYLNGHYDALYNIVFLAPSRYPSAFNAWKLLKFILDFHLRFFPIIAWLIMAAIAVMLAGKTFGHYTIQLMLPLSIISGMAFLSEYPVTARLQGFFMRRTGIIVIILLILSVTMMKIEYILKKDIPREIAAYLKPKLKQDDVIYTGNYHHIIYYLLEKDSPTKYVHRTLLLGENHIRALDINVDEEFDHIMAQKPAYIIVKKEYPVKKMNDYILNNYRVDKEFEGDILIYERVDK